MKSHTRPDSAAQLSRIETGRSTPRYRTLTRLHEALGLDSGEHLVPLPRPTPEHGLVSRLGALLAVRRALPLGEASLLLEASITGICAAVAELSDRLAPLGMRVVEDSETVALLPHRTLTLLADRAVEAERMPRLYDGQYTDVATGLQYLESRYYDPATAQFLTVDPAVAATGSPYGYAFGSPLNVGDPTGLDPSCTIWPSGDWCAADGAEALAGAAQQSVAGWSELLSGKDDLRHPDYVVLTGSVGVGGITDSVTAVLNLDNGNLYLGGGGGIGYSPSLVSFSIAGMGWVGPPGSGNSPSASTVDAFISGYTTEVDIAAGGAAIDQIYSPSTGLVGFSFGLGAPGISWQLTYQDLIATIPGINGYATHAGLTSEVEGAIQKCA